MAAALMAKLIEIERSVGRADALEVRMMVMEAQHLLLDLQQRCTDALATRVCGSVVRRTEGSSNLSYRLRRWSDTSSQLKRDAEVEEAIPPLSSDGSLGVAQQLRWS